jgi:hypothetical protein
VKWSKMRDGLAATGADGVVYRLRRDPLRVEGVSPDGEVFAPVQGIERPWCDEMEAKRWCEEHDAWRQT